MKAYKTRSGYGKDGKPLEWAIQDTILEWLKWKASEKVWKFWRARPAQYIRRFGSDIGFKLDPSEIGLPDIMGTAFGWTIGMEVKRPGKELSENQELWRDDFLRCMRAVYYVVHSLEEAIAVLEELEASPVNPVRMVETSA